jgi:iron-sulfur cluster assembly protein
MLYISDSAKQKVEELMEKQNMDDSYFIRVSVTAGGCSGMSYNMDFDNQLRPDDETFEDNGMKLITDPKSVLYLFGTTLDYSDGLNGKGFQFTNPNASRTCGCGESFAI